MSEDGDVVYSMLEGIEMLKKWLCCSGRVIMPGAARMHQLEGSLTYHVFNRSHCRVPIFADEEDFERFKELIVRFRRRHRCKIYHWVIMGNHYHLGV